MTGDDDGYKQMEDVFASADLEISPLVTKYRKGKLTLNDVLTCSDTAATSACSIFLKCASITYITGSSAAGSSTAGSS